MVYVYVRIVLGLDTSRPTTLWDFPTVCTRQKLWLKLAKNGVTIAIHTSMYACMYARMYTPKTHEIKSTTRYVCHENVALGGGEERGRQLLAASHCRFLA